MVPKAFKKQKIRIPMGYGVSGAAGRIRTSGLILTKDKSSETDEEQYFCPECFRYVVIRDVDYFQLTADSSDWGKALGGEHSATITSFFSGIYKSILVRVFL